jgi:hypothetical protein
LRLSRRLARSGKTSRCTFACTVGLLAALAAPGVAQAHGGGAYLAGSAVGPAPTVDGVVDESEWADAKTYEVVFPGLGNGRPDLGLSPPRSAVLGLGHTKSIAPVRAALRERNVREALVILPGGV